MKAYALPACPEEPCSPSKCPTSREALFFLHSPSPLTSASPAPRQPQEGTEDSQACLFITWDVIHTSKRYFPIDQIRQRLHKQLDLLSSLLSSCTEASKNVCEQVFLYSQMFILYKDIIEMFQEGKPTFPPHSATHHLPPAAVCGERSSRPRLLNQLCDPRQTPTGLSLSLHFGFPLCTMGRATLGPEASMRIL